MAIVTPLAPRDRRALLWDLYRFNARMSLDRLIKGIEFSRCFEYLVAYEALQEKRGGSLLDLGSFWTPFPLFMADRGFRVLATDINTPVTRQKKWARKTGTQAADRFHVALADGRRLGFRPNSFDAITAISTVEHIPSTGDMETMAEFGRLIKPGGLVFISVPYTRSYREGLWGSWFQRYYDYPSLETRLIRASGLIVRDRGFLLGGPSRRFANSFYKLPEKIRLAIGWSHIVLAAFYLDQDEGTVNDAGIAWLLLQRQNGEA